MAKKKTNIDELDAVDSIAEETVTNEPQTVPDTVDKVLVTEPVTTSTLPPTKVDAVAPSKKKRVRIRKKAAKKLSAAIICQNPNITRFI